MKNIDRQEAMEQLKMMEGTIEKSNSIKFSTKKFIIMGVILLIISIIFYRYNLATGRQPTYIRHELNIWLGYIWNISIFIAIFPGRIKYSALSHTLKNILNLYYILFACIFIIQYTYGSDSMGLELIFIGILFYIYGCLTNGKVIILSIVCLFFGLFERGAGYYFPDYINSVFYAILPYLFASSFIIMGIIGYFTNASKSRSEQNKNVL